MKKGGLHMILRQQHFNLLSLLEGNKKLEEDYLAFFINLEYKKLGVTDGDLVAIAKWDCLGKPKFKRDFAIPYKVMKALKSLAFSGDSINIIQTNSKYVAKIGDNLELWFNEANLRVPKNITSRLKVENNKANEEKT